jgi:hypothetical protein
MSDSGMAGELSFTIFPHRDPQAPSQGGCFDRLPRVDTQPVTILRIAAPKRQSGPSQFR